MNNIFPTKSEAFFLHHLDVISLLSKILVLVGFAGFIIAAYAMHSQFPMTRILEFMFAPLFFVMLSMVFLKLVKIIRTLQQNPNIEALATKMEKNIVKKRLRVFYVASIVLLIVSIINTVISVYILLYLKLGVIGRTVILIAISRTLSYAVYGFIIGKASKILQKMTWPIMQKVE